MPPESAAAAEFQSSPKKVRNVDGAVAKARSKIGILCRTPGTTPEQITAARDDLKVAKVERMRRDADALAGEIVDRSKLRILTYGDDNAGPTREDHDALQSAQFAEAQTFKTEHGPSTKWSDESREEWSAMLLRHKCLHEALGCLQIAMCRA